MMQRKFHHGNLREALLKLAGEELEAHGYASLSLRDLAATLGVTSGAPYRHFASRDELLLALAQSGGDHMRDCYRDALSADLPAPARLRLACKAHLDFARDRPELFRLLFASDANWPEVTSDLAGPHSAFGLFERLVTENLDLNDPLEQRTTALTCWSLIHGFAMLRMNDNLGQFGNIAIFEEAVLDFACSKALHLRKSTECTQALPSIAPAHNS